MQFFIDNDNIYNIFWVQGKEGSKGSCFYKNGEVYKGEWNKGKRHGTGVLYLDNERKILYRGSWIADGSYYEGEWLDDKKSGYGRMVYKDGSYYEGFWSKNKKSGLGVFERNLRNGPGKTILLDKNLIREGFWINDVCKCSTISYIQEKDPMVHRREVLDPALIDMDLSLLPNLNLKDPRGAYDSAEEDFNDVLDEKLRARGLRK